MADEIIINNWGEVMDLIGHTTIYHPVEKFIVRTLGIKSIPSASEGTSIISSANEEISLYFIINYDSLIIPQKDNGDYVLDKIWIDKNYKGELPFQLNFSMSKTEIMNILEQQLLFLREGYNGCSEFYFSTYKVAITIFYDEKDNMESIGISAPFNDDIEEYNLK